MRPMNEQLAGAQSTRRLRSRWPMLAAIALVLLLAAWLLLPSEDAAEQTDAAEGAASGNAAASAAPTGSASASAGAPTASVSSSPTASASATATATAAPTLPVEVPGVVTNFTRAWLLHGTEDQRRQALAPYATPGLIEGLMLTDVRELPPVGTQPAGAPTLVQATELSGQYTQQLSGPAGAVVVGVIALSEGRWLVSAIEPAPTS